MNRMQSGAAALLSVAALVGCAQGTAGGPRGYWSNSNLDGNQQRQQYPVDEGECTRVAFTSIPPPSLAPSPQPPVQPTTRQYDITLNTPNGPVYGTAQQQTGSNVLPGTGYGPLDTYNRAQIDNYNRAQMEGAQQARRSVFFGCMAERGWQFQQQ